MCTLHTNVSSKTPSRSPQGSAHPVCGWRRRPECLAKIEFLNPANFFVRYDCYRSNNEEQNWHDAPPSTGFFPYSLSSKSFCHQIPFSFFLQLNASLSIVRNGWSCSWNPFLFIYNYLPVNPAQQRVPFDSNGNFATGAPF